MQLVRRGCKFPDLAVHFDFWDATFSCELVFGGITGGL
jgi:hypothetical protein